MTLALTEPIPTALIVTVFGVLMIASVVFTRALDRLGIPVVLIFLVLGMLAGSEGIGGMAFDNYQFAFRVGAVALILILFDGGLNTSYAAVRKAIAPASVLATAGVLLTAALVAVAGRLMGMPWPHALLIGAIVSSTDAAAVFAVLRGGRIALKSRVGTTLEVESCINDPMAVILTVTVVTALTTPGGITGWNLLGVPVQLAVGLAIGTALGFGGRLLLSYVRPQTVGLYPVVTLAIAFLSFGLATVLFGSGFLAVYVTALILGNGAMPYRMGLRRIHDALAWMSQIGMFLMLGLLVYPSHLIDVAPVGLGLGLFLSMIGRPLAVLACLAPFRYPLRELSYIGWVGLRGAVPIILATFPVMAGYPESDQIFHVVFFIVVVSTLVPGTSIRPVTRLLGLQTPDKPVPSAILEINSTRTLSTDLISFQMDDSLAACGAQLSELHLPEGSSVMLIVRGDEPIPARGNTRLLVGDHVYVFCRPQDRPFIELLFGHPQNEDADA